MTKDGSHSTDGRWLTKKRLAEYLGISERSVDLQLRPHLTAYYPSGRHGRKLLFDRFEVDAYILSQSTIVDI